MNAAKGPNLKIVHLLDVPGAAALLARWFVAEWGTWYGPDGPGDADSDLAACSRRDALPLCLVALNGDDGVLGTAALKTESVGRELGPGPWLAALLVGNDYRGRGVGTALVEAIENEAARLDFTSVYTSTDTATGLLERRGWREFGASESIRGPVKVYRQRIGGEPPGA